MTERSPARLRGLPWRTGVTFPLAPDADPAAVFEFVDDPAEGLCDAGMHADLDSWTLTVTIPSDRRFDVGRWVRHLESTGLVMLPSP